MKVNGVDEVLANVGVDEAAGKRVTLNLESGSKIVMTNDEVKRVLIFASLSGQLDTMLANQGG